LKLSGNKKKTKKTLEQLAARMSEKAFRCFSVDQ